MIDVNPTTALSAEMGYSRAQTTDIITPAGKSPLLLNEN
jgi:hypothetical protein